MYDGLKKYHLLPAKTKVDIVKVILDQENTLLDYFTSLPLYFSNKEITLKYLAPDFYLELRQLQTMEVDNKMFIKASISDISSMDDLPIGGNIHRHTVEYNNINLKFLKESN